MWQNVNVTGTQNGADLVQVDTKADASVSTKDLGRVKLGGSAMRFGASDAATKDSGRARFGGSAMRF
jgi:hypothetical protein